MFQQNWSKNIYPCRSEGLTCVECFCEWLAVLVEGGGVDGEVVCGARVQVGQVQGRGRGLQWLLQRASCAAPAHRVVGEHCVGVVA